MSIQQNSAILQFVPKDLGELVALINKIKKSDRLYVQTFRTTRRRGYRRKRIAESAAFDAGDFEQRPHGWRFQTDRANRRFRKIARAGGFYRFGSANTDD
jgi:hypothetical protein